MRTEVPALEGLLHRMFEELDEVILLVDPRGVAKLTLGNLEKYRIPQHVIGTSISTHIEALKKSDKIEIEEFKLNGYILYRIKEKGASEASLSESILRNIETGVMVLDHEGNIAFQNKKVSELLKWDLEKIFDKLKEIACREGEREEINLEDGRVIGTSAYKIETPQGQFTVFLLKDITEIKELERTVYQLDRISSIGSLTLGLAHEIKNALTGMRLIVEGLLKNEKGKRKEKLERVLLLVQRINKTINSIVNYTRKRTFVLEPVNLQDVLVEVRDLLQDKLESKLIKFRMELPSDMEVLADREALIHIFMNLLLNAIEAVDMKGEIMVKEKSIKKRGLRKKFRAITVEDNGKGMDRETIDRIFMPFFTTKEKGMGLGLFIVAKLLREIGGFYEIESEPGRGTIFTIYLKIP